MTASPPETSVVERVARAIVEAMNLMDALDIEAAQKYARAAIAAMREPTEAMLARHDRRRIGGEMIPALAERLRNAAKFWQSHSARLIGIEAADALTSLSAQLARQQAVVEAAKQVIVHSKLCDDFGTPHCTSVLNLEIALDAASRKEQGT